MNPESWAWAGIITEFEVGDLIHKLAHKKDAEKQGWQIGNVKKAIRAYGEGGSDLVSADELERVMRG